MQISVISFLILFTYFTNSQTVNYRKVTTIPGHTQLITTASFFNDNTRMITGSNDTTVKIW
jgi:WD40 repeat protein